MGTRNRKVVSRQRLGTLSAALHPTTTKEGPSSQSTPRAGLVRSAAEAKTHVSDRVGKTASVGTGSCSCQAEVRVAHFAFVNNASSSRDNTLSLTLTLTLTLGSVV